jgi:hypothetical protein
MCLISIVERSTLKKHKCFYRLMCWTFHYSQWKCAIHLSSLPPLVHLGSTPLSGHRLPPPNTNYLPRHALLTSARRRRRRRHPPPAAAAPKSPAPCLEKPSAARRQRRRRRRSPPAARSAGTSKLPTSNSVSRCPLTDLQRLGAA